MIYRNFISYLSIALLIAILPNWAQAQDPTLGKALFMEKCASCHNSDMKSKLTGPALGGVEERWAKRSELYKWIKNSSGLIAEGNARAVELFAEWQSNMTAFPELENEDIDNILAFVNEQYNKKEEAVASTGTGQTGGGKEKGSNTLVWVLIGILVFAILMLARYINSLNRLAQKKVGDTPGDEKSILELILNPGVVKVFVFFVVILIGYTTVNNAIGLGRQQGYSPTQPINFSHKLHAGDNGIDCKYCHDAARRSKHSMIPATNTCMNCHKAIPKKKVNGSTAEIMKIYASAGFNPMAGNYFEDTTGIATRLEAYQKWAEENSDADSDNAKAEDAAKQVAAARAFIQKPIEWTRIHNLPDHVYFNHSQHVMVGKQDCQNCHGKVEEMEVLKQYAPLSMGWCVNCHRQTNVDFGSGKQVFKKDKDGKEYLANPNGNPYYTGYEGADDKQVYEDYLWYHEQIKANKKKGVTVEDIGGLECQKCHY